MKIIRESRRSKDIVDVNVGNVLHVKDIISNEEKYVLIAKFGLSSIHNKTNFLFLDMERSEVINCLEKFDNLKGATKYFLERNRLELLKIIKQQDCELLIKNY